LVGATAAPGSTLVVGGLGVAREGDSARPLAPSMASPEPLEKLAPESALVPSTVRPEQGPPWPALPLDRLVEAWRELLAQGQADLFDSVESALIHAAFDFASQNQVRTAKALGITRNMLRTQLKRHGLLGAQEDTQEDAAVAELGTH
jgi:sigma-54-specific transcriptional regulator